MSTTSTATTETPSEFVHWKEIEGFHYVVRRRNQTIKFWSCVSSSQDASTATPSLEANLTPSVHDQALMKPSLVYKSKVKLHGSNGGVIVTPSAITPQSRNQILEIIKTGFGKLVKDTHSYWTSLAGFGGLQKFVVFGEYCGPKVQKGVALNLLPHDIFAVFSIDIGEDRLIVEPEEIQRFLTLDSTLTLPPNIFILPWHGRVEFFFDSVEKCETLLNSIDDDVNKIDAQDPWVESTFGRKGHGEGLVFYPVVQEERPTQEEFWHLNREIFGNLAFKAKGVHHRVVATPSSVSMESAKANTPESFARMVCPEARLMQGLSVLGGFESSDESSTKNFLNWVLDDVRKECKAELEASKLKWNDVKELIRTLAYEWYTRQFSLSTIGKSADMCRK